VVTNPEGIFLSCLFPTESLRVLWAARCGIRDLDGVSALEALEELYLAFNDVEDCAALALHEKLSVLDLESNLIADPEALTALASCPALTSLTLLHCPVARATDYRKTVRRTCTTRAAWRG
jgi:Leucine-rich repeat (LRR) protein